MKNKSFVLAGLILGSVVNTMALPAVLPIDFRSAGWTAADGTAASTVGGVTATALPTPNTLRQSATDGLGVDTASRLNVIEDPHEVSPGETLRIDFTGVTGDDITGVWLTKLFDELVDDSGSVQLFPTVGPSVTFSFTGIQTAAVNPLGDFYVDFGGALDITRADFKATGSGIGGVLANRDYSVAGFTKPLVKASVPDGGSTLFLLGSVISGIGLIRRKLAK